MLRQLSSILAASTLLVGIVSAQQAPTLPSCATSCVSSLLPASCNGNPTCICNTASFLDGIACCVFQACDPADQTAALAYAHSICDPVGASSLLPASATCTSTSSGSATSSASGSGSSTAGATGGSTTSAASSAASEASSASAAASSASASASSSLSSASASLKSAASSASASLSSAVNSASQSSSSTTASPTGAANQLAIGFGAVGAGMLGLAALL
ncbi:CFEM domain-containing protein isoform 2 [Cladophialophora immunda]|nr:CFEM domain-containing protein isoform 2 [Cladophialophora immunda]